MDTPMPEAVKKLVVMNVNEVEKVASTVDFVFSAVDMSKEEIKTLMMQLACSMQRLVNLFDIRRNQDGQLTAKGKEHLLIQQ